VRQLNDDDNQERANNSVGGPVIDSSVMMRCNDSTADETWYLTRDLRILLQLLQQQTTTTTTITTITFFLFQTCYNYIGN